MLQWKVERASLDPGPDRCFAHLSHQGCPSPSPPFPASPFLTAMTLSRDLTRRLKKVVKKMKGSIDWVWDRLQVGPYPSDFDGVFALVGLADPSPEDPKVPDFDTAVWEPDATPDTASQEGCGFGGGGEKKKAITRSTWDSTVVTDTHLSSRPFLLIQCPECLLIIFTTTTALGNSATRSPFKCFHGTHRFQRQTPHLHTRLFQLTNTATLTTASPSLSSWLKHRFSIILSGRVQFPSPLVFKTLMAQSVDAQIELICSVCKRQTSPIRIGNIISATAPATFTCWCSSKLQTDTAEYHSLIYALYTKSQDISHRTHSCNNDLCVDNVLALKTPAYYAQVRIGLIIPPNQDTYMARMAAAKAAAAAAAATTTTNAPSFVGSKVIVPWTCATCGNVVEAKVGTIAKGKGIKCGCTQKTRTAILHWLRTFYTSTHTWGWVWDVEDSVQVTTTSGVVAPRRFDIVGTAVSSETGNQMGRVRIELDGPHHHDPESYIHRASNPGGNATERMGQVVAQVENDMEKEIHSLVVNGVSLIRLHQVDSLLGNFDWEQYLMATLSLVETQIHTGQPPRVITPNNDGIYTGPTTLYSSFREGDESEWEREASATCTQWTHAHTPARTTGPDTGTNDSEPHTEQ